MGVPEEELKKITIPAAIIPYCDKMHPVSAAPYACATITQAKLFDYNSSQDEKPMILFPQENIGNEEIIASRINTHFIATG